MRKNVIPLLLALFFLFSKSVESSDVVGKGARRACAERVVEFLRTSEKWPGIRDERLRRLQQRIWDYFVRRLENRLAQAKPSRIRRVMGALDKTVRDEALERYKCIYDPNRKRIVVGKLAKPRTVSMVPFFLHEVDHLFFLLNDSLVEGLPLQPLVAALDPRSITSRLETRGMYVIYDTLHDLRRLEERPGDLLRLHFAECGIPSAEWEDGLAYFETVKDFTLSEISNIPPSLVREQLGPDKDIVINLAEAEVLSREDFSYQLIARGNYHPRIAFEYVTKGILYAVISGLGYWLFH